MLRKYIYCIPVLVFILLPLNTSTYAQDIREARGDEWIKLSSPAERVTIYEKKPLIRCLITVPFARENILVTLDDTDVTNIIDVSKDGFDFVPIQVLSPGEHRVGITLTTPEKKEYKKEFSFTIRHTRAFEEMSSTNDVSFLYEGRLKRHVEGTSESTPHSKIEGNIGSNSRIKEGAFEAGLTANIRYFEQSAPVEPPVFKKFTIPNYLLSAKYQTEKAQLLGEVGDVSVSETANTVMGLSRRGVKFNAGSQNFRFTYFDVNAKTITGLRNFREDAGLDFEPEDRIRGASGEFDFFDKRASFKVIHVYGKEAGASYGTWSAGGGKEGKTTGFLLRTDFFSQVLKTEMEYDATRYDQDTSDATQSVRDDAYRVKLDGKWDKYTYEGIYEYFSPTYSSIGSSGAPRNKEGFALKGGGIFDNIHSLNLALSKYNDNVKSNPLLPTMYTYQGSVNYNFSKFQSLPMGLSYQKTITESKEEPEGTLPIGVVTDSATGRISFIKNAWNFGFDVSYAHQNDQFTEQNDNKNITYNLSSSYNSERFSLVPSFSLNHMRNDYTRVVTDTYTANISIRGNLLEKKLDYEAAYVFNKAVTRDDSASSESQNINFRTGYLLAKQFSGLVNPTVGIRGSYSESHDRKADTRTDDFVVLFFFSTSAPISF